jgi:hypothetical protein
MNGPQCNCESQKTKQKARMSFDWIIQTSQGKLQIDSECAESWPCQHFNNMNLSAIGIWRLIKEQPALKETNPRLWKHFEVFDAPKYANYP